MGSIKIKFIWSKNIFTPFNKSNALAQFKFFILKKAYVTKVTFYLKSSVHICTIKQYKLWKLLATSLQLQ